MILRRALSTALLAGLALSVAAPASAGWETSRTLAQHPVLVIRVAPASTTVSTTAAAPAVAPAPQSASAAYRAEVLRLVNVERARAGARPLKADSCAATYAVRQNSVIATAGTLSHQDLGAVMRGCQARGAGENVAYGNVTPAQMMTMWMNSPGHRTNILRPTFTHLGVGASKNGAGRWYGTQVFLTR